MTSLPTRPKRRRLLLSGSVLLALLIVMVAVLPRTGWVRGLVRDLVSEAATDALNGSLSIGRIEGNLWGSITLRDVTLAGRHDTIASFPSLQVEYELLPLLRKEILLRRVSIDSLHLHLSQSEEGGWNITDIVPPGDSTGAGTAPSAWSVSVPWLSVRALSATIAPTAPVEGMPGALERLDLQGSFQYTANRWKARIESCSLRTDRPVLHLRRLTLTAGGDSERIRIDSLSLTTEGIAVTSSATITLPPERASSGSLRTSTTSFEEVRRFFPDFPLRTLPPTSLTAEYSGDTLHLHGDIGTGTVRLEGTLATGGSSSAATVQAAFAGLDPARWLVSEVPPMNLTGSLRAQASVRDPLRGGAELSLALGPGSIGDRRFKRAAIDGAIDDGHLHATVSLAAAGAELSGRIDVRDLSGAQVLDASIDFRDVDPSTLADLERLPGSLNGSVTVSGGPLSIDRFRGGIILGMQRSEIASIFLDSLMLRCSVATPEATIDTLSLHSPALDFEGSGRAALDGAVQLGFQTRLRDLASLAVAAGLDTIRGRGEIRGRVRTAGDSLSLSGDWKLTDLEGFGVKVDSLAGRAALALGPGSPDLEGEILAHALRAGSIRADSLTAVAAYREGAVSVQSSLALRENDRLRLNALVVRDSLVHLLIPGLELNVLDEQWSAGPDTMRFTLGDRELKISDASVRSGTRSVAASGLLSTTGMNDFTLDVERLPLAYLPALVDSSYPVQGDLSLALRLEGMLPDPVASCSVTVERAAFRDQTLGNSHAVAAYGLDSTLTWQVTTTGPWGNSLAAQGTLPLTHTPGWDSVAVDPDRPLQARLLLQDFQLSKLGPAFPELDRLTGVASSDLSMGGTLRLPALAGSLRIDSGAVASTSLGIAYDSIGIEIAGEDTLLLLRRLHIRSKRGLLNASGILAGTSNLPEPVLRPRQLDVEMQEFLAMESTSLELRLSGPLRLQADRDTLRVDGDLTVPRSRVWLPAFVRQAGGTGDRGTPLLIAALQEGDSAAVRDTLVEPELTRTLLEQVAGRIRVRIPNNTWLQSQEVNVEISGNIELTIEGPAVAIGGFIKVERGTFLVLGKKFVVQEGRADFTGGTDPIPRLSIEVAYSFRRADGMEQSLDLLITGEATNPSLSFRLNGEPVSEQDAVSYVLFGQSLDELSQSQRSSVSQSTADLAAGLAASFLSAQLSSTVGEAFGLDVLEVNVQDAGRQSSFTAGKYLSDDLYVRYTRRINDPSTNETNTDEVALEYRLLPFLYIQLIQGTSKATGYDLLFRFD